jgi:2-polyprenyl-3-methyl-5-hydroxy-6-metoxy-1,4-benzoquinol methylase
MLMLGNQYSYVGDLKKFFQCEEYKSLDPDGGDFLYDIQDDLSFMYEQWDCVFNLGTLEHVWDVHLAYSNAAKLIKVGGFFIGHTPIHGHHEHGVHITTPKAILKFFEINGFENIKHWDHGTHQGVVMWHVAQKITHQLEFKRPQQVWVNGKTSHFE